jgi:hypothetical protein
MLHVRAPDLAEQQTFQPGHTLPIIGADLGKQPMRLATAAGATVTDRSRPARTIAQPRRGTGKELARLQDETRLEKTLDLISWAAGVTREARCFSTGVTMVAPP